MLLLLLLLLLLTLWRLLLLILAALRSLLLRRPLASALTVLLAVEHLHFTGDNLGGVTVLPVLPLPFASAK